MSAQAAAPAATTPAPAATIAPTNPGEAAPSAPVSQAVPSKEAAAPQYFMYQGKPYTQAELEAALETQSTLGKRIGEVSAREAAMAKLKDPSKWVEALKEFGHDPDQLATDHLLALKAQSEMDPKDRELAELRSKVEAAQRADAERAQQVEAAKRAETETRLAELQEKRLVDSATKHGLLVSKRTMASTLALMKEAADQGLDLSEDDAIQLVKQDLNREFATQLKDLSTEQLLALIPKETQKALLKTLTKQALAPTTKAPDARPTTSARKDRPSYLDNILDM